MQATETWEVENHPTDLEGRAERELSEEKRAQAIAAERQADLVWLLENERGRRDIRRQLMEAKLDVRSPVVAEVTDRHHGVMYGNVTARHKGEQLLWAILRLALRDDRLLPSLQKLFLETDE